MKIQEILLNTAESLEKELGEQLNLKQAQSQGDEIMKENIQNAAVETLLRPINHHQVSHQIRATEPKSGYKTLEQASKKE